ncbi:MAG: HEAT repeat domain-containing protein [Actinobacteria bacterium]|nr:HEAT repeat domain-containing protein [Actinomycetota bacterium]
MSELHEMLQGQTIRGTNGDIDLHKRISEIKSAAKDWLKDYGRNGYEHSKRLEDYLNKLTEKARIDTRILPAEAFILLCAVYMHDLGYMVDSGLNPIKDPNPVGHPDRSQQMVVRDYTKYLFGDFPHLENAAPRVAQAVGLVCVGHSEDRFYPLDNLDRFTQFTDQAFGEERIDLKRLAAFLRMADEADDPYIRIIGSGYKSGSARQNTSLVRLINEKIEWHWADDDRGDYEKYVEYIDEKRGILQTAINYIGSLDLGNWDMILRGGDQAYIPRAKYVDYMAEYRRQVLEDTEFVRMSGIDDGSKLQMPLERVYIKLQATKKKDPKEEKEERDTLLEILRCGENYYRRGGLFDESRRHDPIYPEKALEENKRLVILGPPGSGKSTLLRYLARKATEKGKEQVPILVNLRDYATELGTSPSRPLRDYALEVTSSGDEELKKALDGAIRNNHVLWLLDGQDEARDWADKIAKETSGLPGQLILSSRPIGYVNIGGLCNLPRFEVLPLRVEDVDEYMMNWFKVLAEERGESEVWEKEQVKWLQDQVEERQKLKPLMKNPLLLTFFIFLAGDDPRQELPETRSDLYRHYIERLYGSWETRRTPEIDTTGRPVFKIAGLEGEKAKSAAIQSLYFMGWILHFFYYGGKPEVPEKDSILKRLAEHLADSGFADSETIAQDALAFWNQAGLIEIIKGVHQKEYLAFRHMTFQEYAGAWGLNELWNKDSNRAWEFLQPRLHHYAWHEPILLLTGMMEREHLEDLIKLLLKETGDNEEMLHRGLFLASELIGEQTYNCPTVTKEVIDRLERLYKNKDWHVRLAATQALRGIGGYRAVEPLIKALTDINSDVRRATAEALGNIGDDRAVEALVKSLRDDDWGMRQVSADALGNICGDGAVELFKDILKYGEEGMRQVIAQALGNIGGDRAVELLIEMIKDGDWQGRYATIQALGNIGGDRAVELLNGTLADKNSDLRWGATLALGNIGGDIVTGMLVGVLGDEESLVRQMAARALGNIGGDIVMGPLLGALWDEESGVRQEAARALGNIGGDKVLEALIGALGNEDCQSRRSAALALGNIGDDRAYEALMNTLMDKDKDVRWAAALALGNIGDDRAVDPLIGMLKDEDWQVRHISAQALGNIGDDRAVEPLISTLADEERQVCHITARALGNIGGDRAVELLIEMLKDEDCQLRLAAAEALGNIGGDRAVEPLIDNLGDEDWWVCEAAAESLEKLAGSTTSFEKIELISKSAKEYDKYCLLRTVTTRLGVMKGEENPIEDPLLEVMRMKN